MRKYFDVVFLTTSIPASGAYVYVLDSSGNRVPLFSDNGVTSIPNPVATDRTGFFSFYVADGIYTLQYVLGGNTLRTLTNVQIYDESQFVSGGGANFGPAIAAWFATLPTSLPAQSGVFWNNGGTLAQS